MKSEETMRKRVYTPIKSYKFKDTLEKTTDNICGFTNLITYETSNNEWRRNDGSCFN